MLANPKLFKFEVNKSNYAVIITLDKNVPAQKHEAPELLCQYARKIMNEFRERGLIEVYQIYRERLQQVWQCFWQTAHCSALELIIAQGSPKLVGLRFEPELEKAHIAGYMSFENNPQFVSTWQYDWIKITIEEKLNRQIDYTQAYACWMRKIVTLSEVKNYPIYFPKNIKPAEPVAFSVRTYSFGSEIALVVNDLAACQDKEMQAEMFAKLYSAIQKASLKQAKKVNYSILHKHIIRSLETAGQGPQKLGIELPMTIMGGLLFDAKSSIKGLNNQEDETLLDAFTRESSFLSSKDTSSSSQDIWSRTIWPFRDELAKKIHEEKAGHDKKIIKRKIHSGFIEWLGQDEPYHRTAVKLCGESITRVPYQRRMLLAMTVHLSRDEQKELFEKLLTFKHYLLQSALAPGFRDQIYQINLHAFPITSPIERPENRDERSGLSRLSDQWCKIAIKEMAELQNFHPSVQWISKRLYPPISLEQIASALDYLLQAKLIRFDEKLQKYVSAGDVATEKDTKGQAVVHYHLNQLMLAKEALLYAPASERSLSGITLAVNDDMAEKIKNESYQFFSDTLGRFGKSGKSSQIYQLNFQLFPLTT